MDQSTSNRPQQASYLLLITLLVIICSVLVPLITTHLSNSLRQNDDIRQTHNKLGLEPDQTNLRSQFSSEHQPMPGRPVVLQSLWIYPVKSCQGIEVSKSKVVPSGLEFDRLYTFAVLKKVTVPIGSQATGKDQYKWEFITQRQYPLLASLKVELWQPDPTKSETKSSGYILFRFPWQGTSLRSTLLSVIAKVTGGWNKQLEKEVRLPVDFPSNEEIQMKGYTYGNCSIWKDNITALNMERELPPELSHYLGTRYKLSLFRIDPGHLREVHRCAPTKDNAGYQPVTGFQDAYPVHLMNIASVQDLASRIKMDDDLPCLDVERFRANIVISGATAYDEDEWKQITFRPKAMSDVDESSFHVSCRTVRCKQPNVNQITGAKHPVEPFKAMRTHRRVDDGAPLKGCIGMEMTPLFSQTDIPANMERTLVVGMTLEVNERGSHWYIDS
ncbi:MOSC domain-containing protein [Ilyonectria destructans]|nr:MOSC domain-containing protein [Ilyonectria destructans]